MFFNTYPYTDFHELNLDWIISKIQEYETSLDRLKAELLEATKEYVDQELLTYQQQINELIALFNEFKTDIATMINELEESISIRLNNLQSEINSLKTYVDTKVAYLENRTDIMFEENNQYILDNIQTYISNVLVLNYFTGEYLSIQEMFDYLCTLHATDAINYSTLISRNLTYTDVINKNATYTQIAFNGNNILI